MSRPGRDCSTWQKSMKLLPMKWSRTGQNPLTVRTTLQADYLSPLAWCWACHPPALKPLAGVRGFVGRSRGAADLTLENEICMDPLREAGKQKTFCARHQTEPCCFGPRFRIAAFCQNSTRGIP